MRSEFFHTNKTGKLTLIGFHGRHLSEPQEVDECRTELLALIASDKCQVLVVDLMDVEVISSWVLGIPASVHQQGIEVHIYHVADEIRGVSKATHLDPMLNVRDGLDQLE